jgi:hypothetical protein
MPSTARQEGAAGGQADKKGGKGKEAAAAAAAPLRYSSGCSSSLSLRRCRCPIRIELVQPFSDAIHNMEGGRPLLPQVTPLWEHLRRSITWT